MYVRDLTFKFERLPVSTDATAPVDVKLCNNVSKIWR